MKKIFVIAALICCLSLSGGIAGAVTLDLGVESGATITFTGSNNQFEFVNNNTFDFHVSSYIGSDSSTGTLKGNISGPFTIGTITTNIIPFVGIIETAPVSGLGSFSIEDSNNKLFSATIQWIDVFTYKSAGAGNLENKANLSSISYDGINVDLITLKNSPIATLSFQFVPAKSLTQLTTDGTTNSTSYSITMNAVPIPGALLLLGAGMVRLAAYARRRQD
jgi:hypothetical protein